MAFNSQIKLGAAGMAVSNYDPMIKKTMCFSHNDPLEQITHLSIHKKWNILKYFQIIGKSYNYFINIKQHI